MMLLAYGAAVVIAIPAATIPWRLVQAGGPARVVVVRLLAGFVATACAAVIVAVVASAGGSATGRAIAGVAVTGALLYGAGLLLWSGLGAMLLRLGGWALMMAAAAVPSHLTLLLPLIATLTATLHRAGPAPP
jgi:hypothetical protein